MKWRLCAAVAALSLLLSGCSSLLARSYTSVTPHSATPPAEGDSSILRVENYQELVNALIYLISLGEEEGTVRMYNYDQDVEQSLSNACLEVVQEDPLGAYSVDFIRYDVTPIVSYYEAAVEITYRRTREQVSAIVAATGATAIRSQLKDLLSSFGTEAAPAHQLLRGGRDLHPNPLPGGLLCQSRHRPGSARGPGLYLSPRGGERPPAHRGGPAYLPPGAERAPAPPDRPGPARQ